MIFFSRLDCQKSVEKLKSPKKKLFQEKEERIPQESFVSDDKNAFRDLWHQIMEIVNSVNHQVNKQLFNNLAQFCQSQMLDSNYIPAASVITGVNIPDHHSFFNNLKEHLQNNVTPMVALLYSKDCNDTKQTIQNFVKQIFQIIVSKLKMFTAQDSEKHLSRDNLNIPYLQTCYQQYVSEMKIPSPKKRQKNCNISSGMQPIVVILEDLESFSSSTIEDFILICSKYTSKLPIQLILGISTAATAIHTTLPYKALAQILLHSFSSESATVHLTQIIDAVLMKEDVPFKLGHRIFRLLLDNFLYHDFSISNFISGLKFSMLEHYYKNPLNYLCCQRRRRKKMIKHMESSELDKFRRVVSFMNYVEKQSVEEQKKLLLDDDHFKKVLKDLLKEVQNHHKRIIIILSALMSLVQDIPGYPLGKQIREVYSICLEGNLTETEGFKKAFQILREISLTKKRPSEFEAIRSKVLSQLEEFFKKTLTSPTRNAFHEIFYFNDISSIKKHFIVSPRACLQRALTNPAHYLKCDCCELKSNGEMLSTLPDICIVYKLMLECGRLVNLYDWLQAFHTVITGERSSEKPDDIVQARFIHAVSELQFFGYIKPTKKKTDHMARLTWG
ncbi:Origin recognition complex subunit 3 [Nymphon striatum]|nr:Origin recognition complex subunit 3 [Nymphon striatum]